MRFGDFTLTVVNGGNFRLDGGAMHGVVPKTIWNRLVSCDELNRVEYATNCLLVEGHGKRTLIETGNGDKFSRKECDIYGIDHDQSAEKNLRAVGVEPDSIDNVVMTHLHFDHSGGATRRGVGGKVEPVFKRARHVIQRGELADATHPHERNRASYLQDDFVPLAAAGVVDFYDDDRVIKEGVRIVRSGGHTGQHQVVFVESGGRTALFPADLIPTTAHLPDAWVTGYDLFPMESLAFKKRLIRDAIDREYLVFFEHDPHVAAGYIREKDGRRFVEPVL
jgi:glyoxylase-like metal-dependent hydrolase (beta-lactamase superfamily II)